MNWRKNNLAKKTEKELKKVQEENIQKFDEEMRQNRKIPKEYKKKINKQIMLNILILLAMAIYLICLNVSSL